MATESQEIAEVVSSWLHYKSLTGLRDLFNEASMAAPIAEYLAVSYGKEVRSELVHPVLAKKKGKGRPAQIDFVHEKRSVGSWHTAFECKFQTSDYYKIVWDICRLVVLSQAENIGRPKRKLVYAAKLDAKNDLLGNSFRPGDGPLQGYFDGILPRSEEEQGTSATFTLTDLHDKKLKAFRMFARDHQVGLPSRLKIELSGYSRVGGFVCCVWTIQAAQGSVLKSHEELVH